MIAESPHPVLVDVRQPDTQPNAGSCPCRLSGPTSGLAVARRQHPWFTMHLPRYLAVMQADTVATASSIDSELVSEVAALGFDREFITESIRHRVQVPRYSPAVAAWPAALFSA